MRLVYISFFLTFYTLGKIFLYSKLYLMLGQNNVLQSQFQFSNLEQIEKEELKKKKLKKNNNKSANVPPKGFYYNIQVIRKVATFLQNVKLGAVREQINLKPQDLAYINNEEEFQESDENLFRYDNKYIVCTEIIVLLASLFCLWKNSYELIFGKFEEISLSSLPALIIQILYKFIYMNTELKNEKLEIISTRRQILMNYLHNFVIFDLLYFIGSTLEYIDNIYIFYPSKLMGLCIIVTFISISDKLENIFAKTATLETLMAIIKLLVKIMVFIHFLSLLFNCMTIIEKQNGMQITWVEYNFQEQLGNFEKYINGWYWGSTILSTVGFGDITPANVWERGFISFVEVFCCAMFGYCVNYIGTMIGLFGQSKATYQKDIRRLNYYLKSVQIPEKLKNQIRSHFYNKYQIEQVYNPQAQEYLFSKFTDKITSQIKQNNNLNIISQSQPLNIFSQELIHKLAGSLNKAVYAPSELVFEENSSKSKLFIVEEGEINEIPSNQKFLKKIKPLYTFNNEDESSKNTFGWFNFITGEKYTTCAKANKFSIVYQLLRDDFLNIIKQFKNDCYKFLQTKQKLTINPVTSVKQCLICGRLTHNVSNCPRIHFIPKKIYSLLLHEKKKTMLNSRRYYKRAEGFKTKMLYPMDQDESIDEVIQSQSVLPHLVSKKRLSIDKLNNTLNRFNPYSKQRKNTLAAKRNSSLLQMTPHMKQIIQAAQNIQSSQSINFGAALTGTNNFKTIDQFPQSTPQVLPKSKKLINKLDRVLLDQTQFYFPACHITKILEQILGRNKQHIRKPSFVFEKQVSKKLRDRNIHSNRKMCIEDQID